MTLLEAIKCRHSVRQYIDRPLEAQAVAILKEKIAELNKVSGLHIQLVTDEPKAFRGVLAYGKFGGVSNYFVMAGPKGDDLDERVGYYGEQLVLLAQTLGLNTCWAGLTYRKIDDTYELRNDEKIVCYIALGYGKTQGVSHKGKTAADISNAGPGTPQWFNDAIDAVLLAPTAVNQQKFYFEYLGDSATMPRVRASRRFSLVGYTKIDLGIAKLHFEIAATHPFTWA